jgi:hypothetical protein
MTTEKLELDDVNHDLESNDKKASDEQQPQTDKPLFDPEDEEYPGRGVN